ncbi:MAG: hypothetical protein ACE5GQ_06340, partial [Nitrospinales bacterium]
PLIALKSTKETQDRLRRSARDLIDRGGLLPELDENDIYHKAFSMSVFGGHRTPTEKIDNAYRMLVLW